MTSPVRARVLAAVERNDITRKGSRLRWWITETEHRRLTNAERLHLYALISDGEVEFLTAGGYSYGTPIGFYVRARK